ncbi:hypothetical protein JCM3766R1_005000 [Sporobolomyces carnicolor]
MLASTLIPLAIVGAIVPSVAASPIYVAGQAPSVGGPDGVVSPELLRREFEQGVARGVAQLAARSPETPDGDCAKKARRSRKAKRSTGSVPLVNVDGSDLGYFAPARVGTSQQETSLLVDTGSADILVPRKTEQWPENTFDPKKSRTFIEGDGTETAFAFGQGTTLAPVVQDKIQIGPWIKIKQHFGLFDPAFIGGPHGLLGLSWPSLSKIKGGMTFFERLRHDKNLDADLFGLYHSRGQVSGSQLTLGAVDASRYEGELTALPVKAQLHWTLQMNEASIDGEKVFDGPVYSAIDSGSTFAIIPKAITDAFFARVPGVVIDPNFVKTTIVNGETVVGQVYLIPCDTKVPDLAFTFDGSSRAFNIASEDAIVGEYNGLCISSIMGADVTYAGQKAALIGLPFLKSWYSVFDFEDATVSFAAAKH